MISEILLNQITLKDRGPVPKGKEARIGMPTTFCQIWDLKQAGQKRKNLQGVCSRRGGILPDKLDYHSEETALQWWSPNET